MTKTIFWQFGLGEGPQSCHFRWPSFCQEVSWEKPTKTKFLAIWPQGGSPKWPLPMAILLPGSSLTKTIFGHLTSGRVPKEATSDGHYFSNVASPDDHHFSREFPDKNYFLAIWPQEGSPKWPLPMATISPESSLKIIRKIISQGEHKHSKFTFEAVGFDPQNFVRSNSSYLCFIYDYSVQIILIYKAKTFIC